MPRRGILFYSWLGSMAAHATLLLLLGYWVLNVGSEAAGPQLLASTESAPASADLSTISANLDQVDVALDAESLAMPAVELPTATIDPWELASAEVSDPFSGLDLTGFNESLAASSSGGTEGTPGQGRGASFFGSTAYGKSFVFVLDVSGSMGDDFRYQAAAVELLASVQALNPDQWFCVILFSTGTRALYDVALDRVALVPAQEDHKQRLASWLASVAPDGGTDPRQALLAAIALRPDAIFLLSDGEFRGSPGMSNGNRMAAIAQISTHTIQLVSAANRDRTPIHAIAFVDPVGQAAMQALAQISGGTYRFVPNARVFRNALRR